MAGRGTRDWDATTYDRVSTPQQDWARPVVERLPLRGDGQPPPPVPDAVESPS